MIITQLRYYAFAMLFQSSLDFADIEKGSETRGVSEGGAGGAIAPPLFGRIEGAAASGATAHYYLYYYLTPTFRKPLTPLLGNTIN